MTEDPHKYRMLIGKYKDKSLTRVPAGYLRWMVNEGHAEAHMARIELERRGSILPEFEVSGHAMDRASLMCLAQWKKDRKSQEGLHAWLCRAGIDALAKPAGKNGRHAHANVLWVFATSGEWPVLVTVMPEKHTKKSKPLRQVEATGDKWPFPSMHDYEEGIE